MADCTTKLVIENEEYWAKWKENKCTNFEKPSSKICEGKKRDEKKLGKIAGLCTPLVRAKAGEANELKNGREMVKYLRYPKEQIEANGQPVDLMPAQVPSFSDFLYPLLCDQDPDQEMEEEFKNKNN
jgi:hypothetical protein